MKRFPAFDPPEYVDWRPDPELVRGFPEAWSRDPERAKMVRGLSRETKLALYAGLVRTRLHDVMLKRWVRQGVISKAWLGTGEEAATVGPVHALDRVNDIVAPMIRNAGACCEMGMPVADMLRGYLGTYDAPSRGRDGHVGNLRYRVLQPISNIGNMPPVTAGIALSFVLRGERRVALTWIGDGSVKSGPTHEALNFAAVMRLPAVFIVQNNQVALGTRVEQAHLPGTFEQLHQAYGCAGSAFDGNNVLDAYAATRLAADRCRAGEGPVILSAETFRMGGHATHDEQEARVVLPPELFAHWGQRDPIGLYEAFLKLDGFAAAELEAVESEVTAEVDRAADEALLSRQTNMPRPESAIDGVYA
ncbi:MAG: thiamine pyrophosphate-dependent dehydrogenase E1 component subunit alpha [Gemmatimonadetes bacterium]|nr:thiamine pyrophosphate-dependent dehydrogenase E1 component subunit alpha [Gemmatimonadota bacterium]